jgi:hypothetical protein
MQVREAIRNAANHAQHPDVLYGWGVVDAYNAVLYHGLAMSNVPTLVVQPDSTTVISTFIASKSPIALSSVKFFYSTNRGLSFSALTLTPPTSRDRTNTGFYSAVLPRLANGTLIDFYFEATDSLGTRQHPYNAPTTLFHVKYGETVLTDVPQIPIPTEFALEQNFPNPFNPRTTIQFVVPPAPQNAGTSVGTGITTIKVYDILGREVAVLVNEPKRPGMYQIEFDGGNLPSGVYFYRLSVADAQRSTLTRKMILIR